MTTVDASEVDDLARDLDAAATRIRDDVTKVVHRGANNVVRDAREHAPKSPVIRFYPFTITYDIIEDGDTIAAEIGPDREKNGQAKLGHLFEYGTSSHAPRAHLGPALDRELPAFEKHVGEAGGEAIR